MAGFLKENQSAANVMLQKGNWQVLFLHPSPHSQARLESGRESVFRGREADEAAPSLINAAAAPLFPRPRLPARQRGG